MAQPQYTGPERRHGMARYLSQLDVWATAFGCIVGWGAFVMPGTTFLPLAGPGGTTIGMVTSTLIMLIVGANYAFLMTHRPRTGGVYAYTKEVFGRDHAFICSWFLSLSYISIVFLNATALFVVSRTLFGSLLQFGIRYEVAGYSIYTGEVALSALALIGVGALFIRQKIFLQHLQTLLAITLLVGSIGIAAICLPHLDPSVALDTEGIVHHDLAPAVMTIVLLSPWAFVGYDVISLETVHFDFSVRKSGKLIALSIVASGFAYTALSLAASTAIPPQFADWRDYLSHLDELSDVIGVPTFYAAQTYGGTVGVALAGITALAAILTGIIGAYRATLRMLATMAEDRIVPDSFGSTTVSIVFIMIISIAVSFLGRNALNWFVELTTFGAIVGFGYTSLTAHILAKREGGRLTQASGVVGTLIVCTFAVVQMVPHVTVFETMGPESFFMLAIWCLLGFVFYWKTMSQTQLAEHTGYFVSSTVLFSLMLYSLLMWYILMLLRADPTASLRHTLIRNSIVLVILVFAGLLVMLYVQNMMRQHQEELEREMIHAEANSRAKSQFLFNMSHDIRTPMNAIIGLTGLAQEQGVTPEQKDEFLDKIERSSQQLLGIINDVLDMSRIESGAMELSPEPMSLVVALDDMRDLFRPQMESKGITYTVETSDLTDPWVVCDRNRLSRVLLNLVSNAYKFTPEGGQVSVRLRQRGSANGTGHYELLVRDTGIGMSQDFVEHMYTPFERERTSTVSRQEGTGLGLAITKSIVELMHGAIDVDTAPERGTEFRIRLDLPVAEAQDEDVDERSLAHADISGTHLLLAEDIEINRQIAQMVLDKHGCTVDMAVNGQEALDKVREAPAGTYDAILMDIQMPVMDGYEATRAIRALEDPQRADIPVIAMTANAFKEDEEAAAAAGMQGHIAKPIEVDKMVATIARVLGSRPGPNKH